MKIATPMNLLAKVALLACLVIPALPLDRQPSSARKHNSAIWSREKETRMRNFAG